MGQTTFSGPVASQNGFIENSFTTAERDAIVDPTAGLLIYNTDTNTYEVFNGEGFQPAFGGGGGGTTYSAGVDYSSNPGSGAGINFFDMGGFSMILQEANWFNTNYTNLYAQGPGTVYDVILSSGSPGTFTTTSPWSLSTGQGSVNGNSTAAPGTFVTQVLSISFS